MGDAKPLAQVAYEAFRNAQHVADDRALSWEQIASPPKQGGSPLAVRVWEDVAAAVERVTLARLKRPEFETFRCGDCGARLMKGERHDCAAIQQHNRRVGFVP